MTNIIHALRKWYLSNGRSLPWRETRNPYHIWVSEIILQQTQVKQGLDYYHRFIKAFPHVAALAGASENEVLKQWQGLGYYSRARNMHHTAKVVQDKHAGKFPDSYSELLKLKGIGPYTAAAMASIAFDLPHALVDGNVFRVLARCYAIATPIDTTEGKKEFEKIASALLDKNDPSTHNQAMMELGALVCKPANPGCQICPLKSHCQAFAAQAQTSYPVKSPRADRRKRYMNYFIITRDNCIAIHKRNNDDIWKGLYQLPLFESTGGTPNNLQSGLSRGFQKEITSLQPIKKTRHLLTHQELQLSFYKLTNIPSQMNLFEVNSQAIKFVPISRLDNYPFPQPIKKFLAEFLGENKKNTLYSR